MGRVERLRALLNTCPFLELDEGNRVKCADARFESGDDSTPDSARVFAEGENFRGGRVRVDGLGEGAVEYSLSLVPGDPWARRYTNGGGVRQIHFYLQSRDYYDPGDASQNAANLDFYERFAAWLEAAARGGGWAGAEATTHGYAFDVDDKQETAVYQIQCRALYTD